MENNQRDSLVRPGERVDDLQNGYYVIQNPQKFCFGMDAVLPVSYTHLDVYKRQIEQDGQRMFAEYTENLERARKRLRKGSCIRLVEPGDPAMNVFDADRSKIILSTVHSTMNGCLLYTSRCV